MKYNVSCEYGVPGHIHHAESPINSVKDYVREINIILDNPDKSRLEVDVASEGYGKLRSAVEVFIEKEMLQSVVKRYQKNISLSLLPKVDGEKIDSFKAEIIEIFEKCCGYISGHSNPEIVVKSPTLITLRSDFDQFKRIRKEFVS